MRHKIFADIVALLTGNFFISVWLTYKVLGYYEVDYFIFGAIYLVGFVSSMYFLFRTRKKYIHIPNNNLLSKLWDFLLPTYLLFWGIVFIVWTLHLGDIFDENFGKRFLDSIDSRFTRFWLDIYATSANGLPVPTETSLIIVIFFTVISRFLGAIHLGAKKDDKYRY